MVGKQLRLSPESVQPRARGLRTRVSRSPTSWPARDREASEIVWTCRQGKARQAHEPTPAVNKKARAGEPTSARNQRRLAKKKATKEGPARGAA